MLLNDLGFRCILKVMLPTKVCKELSFFLLYNLFAGFDTTALEIDKIFLVVGPVLKCTLSSTVAGPFLLSSCLQCDVAGLLHR